MSKQRRARAVRCATPSDGPDSFFVRWGALWAGVIIVLTALGTYHNSFSGPFVLDDRLAITDNPTIQHFETALFPPASATTGGRPLLNLTYALNYALGGMNVGGYHIFNLLVHTLASLTLFGLVRRILLRQGYGRQALTSRLAAPRSEISDLRFEIVADATPLALAVAVIWMVHPLQTEAVTYISQRAESLMGLFYLLTLYCFIRGAKNRCQAPGVRNQAKEFKTQNPEAALPLSSGLTPDAPRLPVRRSFSEGGWLTASVLFCFLGVLTKELIVTAPVMVLLYDRTFVAGSFREAWRLRWRYYLGLACTWLLLARLMFGLGQRSVGFKQGITWWSYALTSCRSVVLYCKLAIWPHPLVFDYGAHFIQYATEAMPYALVLAALLAAVVLALRYRPALGFAGAWFFVILAPTSSVVPVALQPMADHRLYLSLAAVVALGVLGLHRLVGRRGLIVCAAAAVGLGWLSVQRNKDYKSELTIWSDTVAKCPDNARALYNLGNTLAQMPNRIPEAIAAYKAALRVNPGLMEAHNNLGLTLLEAPGSLPDAIAEFEAALRIRPDSANVHYNLGAALLKMPGRLPDAITQYEAALRLDPGSAETHNDLGNALFKMPERLPEAIGQYEAALRINPEYAQAHNNLGGALLKVPGRLPDAITQFQTALRLDPDFAPAHYNLGLALSQIPGRLPDTIAQYEAALRIDPGSAETHYNLGNALMGVPGRLPDAVAQYEAALRISPDYVEAHNNLAEALSQIPNRLSDAIAQFETALRIKPDYVEAHYNFGNVLLQSGRFTDALGEYKIAIQLKPNYAEAHNNLGNTLAELGRLPEAIEQYELALRIKPDYVNAREDLKQVQKAMAQQAAGSEK
jgi:tetratricopeptide (TPR) repeat protein